MTVFGDRVFKEVIKISEVIGVGPNPVCFALYKRRKLGHRNSWRKDHVKTKEEADHLQGKKGGLRMKANLLRK